jgi:hypothetical protein
MKVFSEAALFQVGFMKLDGLNSSATTSDMWVLAWTALVILALPYAGNDTGRFL